MRKLVVAFGVAAFAVGGLAACGDDGDSAEELQEEVAENRLGGCLQDAGIDIDVFTELNISGLDEIIDGLFEQFGDATDIGEVDDFFTEFDEELSDFSEDLTDEDLTDADLTDDFGSASGEFSEDIDDAFSDDGLFDFLDCLGISEQEFSDYFEEQFSDDFSDDFTDDDFTDDDFTDDDFTDDDFSDEFTEGTDDEL